MWITYFPENKESRFPSTLQGGIKNPGLMSGKEPAGYAEGLTSYFLSQRKKVGYELISPIQKKRGRRSII